MASTNFSETGSVISCILSVSAGTECPTGGDAGDTFFHLKEAGAAMFVAINSGEFQQVDSVTLQFVGDWECDSFLDALAFGFGEIRKQRGSTPKFKN